MEYTSPKLTSPLWWRRYANSPKKQHAHLFFWVISIAHMDKVNVLVFGGSLRTGSYSTAIMRAAVELAPAGVEVELFERLGEFPLFNADQEGKPPVVVDFKSRVKVADSILVVTPEYNYSIPGYLKNAIDWASRPYGDNAFAGKPSAIISSSTGLLGGSRAQYHLRQCFVFLDMHPINLPECMIVSAKDKIGTDGMLTDQNTRQRITEVLGTLAAWTRKLKQNM